MRALGAVVAILLALTPTAEAQLASAPRGRCQFKFENATPNTHIFSVELPSKQRNYYIGGGIIVRCPAQKMVLKSDSLEIYGDEGRYYFVGKVDYSEPRAKMKSDYMTYFQREERIFAVGNVDAKLATGSTLTGPQVEFWRAIARVRPRQRAVAIGRPTLSLVERAPGGRAEPPVLVTGNAIIMDGDSTVYASGGVTVVRPELRAEGDSLHLDGARDVLHLRQRPRLVGTKGRPFSLAGRAIDLFSRRRKLERVTSSDSAVAESDGLTLRADSVDLRITDDLLQRSMAWGASRATATSATQRITADSIDVRMPGQRVREMYAVRKASAEGETDSTRFRTTERDRITGDTIVARFDSIPSADTSRKPRIQLLVSRGSATSLQHLAPKDTACRRPAINYVRGQLITVNFDSSGISRVRISDRDPVPGVYLEPDAGCGRSAADSAAATTRGTPGGTPGGSPAGTVPPAPGRPTPVGVTATRPEERP